MRRSIPPTHPAAGSCVVWWAAAGEPAAPTAPPSLLDSTERQRWGTFWQAADRQRYAVGVVLTRLVVGAALGQRPEAVVIDRRCGWCERPHGRPVVAGGPAVSVSHAGGLVGVAIGPPADIGLCVGLDVEPVGATAHVEEVAADLLSSAEHDALAGVQDRPGAVLRTWVRKEAALKAIGRGLADDPRELTVSISAATVERWPAHQGTRRLVDLRARSGYVASLALLAGPDGQPALDGLDVQERDGDTVLRVVGPPLGGS